MPGAGTGRRDGMLQEDAALVRKRIGPRVSRVAEFDWSPSCTPSWAGRAWQRRAATPCATPRNRWNSGQPQSENETALTEGRNREAKVPPAG